MALDLNMKTIILLLLLPFIFLPRVLFFSQNGKDIILYHMIIEIMHVHWKKTSDKEKFR